MTTCAYLGHLYDNDLMGRVLLVVPSPLIRQWRQELDRFLPTMTVTDSTERWVRQPSKLDRVRYEEAFPEGGPDIEIVSYEHLRSRADLIAEKQFRAVVFDEAAALKGRGAEHEAALLLSERAERTLALSATPIENDLMETYGQLRVLRVPNLPTEQTWGDRYVKWKWTFGPGQDRKPDGVNMQHVEELQAFLSTCVLRRTTDDAGLSLPEFVDSGYITVPLTPPQEAAYRAAEGIRGKRGNMLRENAVDHIAGRSAKAEAAVGWMLANQPPKVIVWAEKLDHLTVVERLLDQAGVSWVRIDGTATKTAEERAAVLDIFRDDPTVPVLIASTVLERGLNLAYCRVLISLGSTYNQARERQREGRIRRLGSPHRTVQHLTFISATDHEYRKWRTVSNRRADALTVLGA